MKLGNKVKILGKNIYQDYKDKEGIIIGAGSSVGGIIFYNIELDDAVLNTIIETELEHIPLFKVGDNVIFKDLKEIHPDNRNQKAIIEKVIGKNMMYKNYEFEYIASVYPEGNPSYYIQTEETHIDLLQLSNKEEITKCTCDIMSLMAVGCKCGQIQREKELASQVLFQGKWV